MRSDPLAGGARRLWRGAVALNPTPPPSFTLMDVEGKMEALWMVYNGQIGGRGRPSRPTLDFVRDALAAYPAKKGGMCNIVYCHPNDLPALQGKLPGVRVKASYVSDPGYFMLGEMMTDC